jgi:hypothetical protein
MAKNGTHCASSDIRRGHSFLVRRLVGSMGSQWPALMRDSARHFMPPNCYLSAALNGSTDVMFSERCDTLASYLDYTSATSSRTSRGVSMDIYRTVRQLSMR